MPKEPECHEGDVAASTFTGALRAIFSLLPDRTARSCYAAVVAAEAGPRDSFPIRFW